MNPLVTYIAGLVAAFTPCVIVLIPLMLYRFFNTEQKLVHKFGLFIAGFVASYVILGFGVHHLLNSEIHNGFRLGLGLFFIIIGILALLKKIQPLNIPVVKNTFLLGMVFAVVMVANPCALPYLGIVFALESQSAIIVSLGAFGLGMITPAVLFAIFGQQILTTMKTKKVFSQVSHLMNCILIIVGIGLIVTVSSFNINDIVVESVILVLIFIIILKSYFIVLSKKDLLKPKNILLFLALILIIASAVHQCNSFVASTMHTGEGYTCGEHIFDCAVCMKCSVVFGIAAVLGFLGILLTAVSNAAIIQKKERKKVSTKKTK